MSVTKQLTIAIDFHCRNGSSQVNGNVNCLVTNIQRKYLPFSSTEKRKRTIFFLLWTTWML